MRLVECLKIASLLSTHIQTKKKKTHVRWNLTAKTILSTNEWKELFKNCNYGGRLFLVYPMNKKLVFALLKNLKRIRMVEEAIAEKYAEQK